MQYSSLNLFVKYNDIFLAKSPIQDKFISIMILSENDNTLNTLNKISFAGKTVKQVIVPNSLAPFRTYMSADYKSELQKFGFIPYKSDINDLNKVSGKHIFIDTNKYIYEVSEKLHVKIFNNTKFRTLFDSYFNNIVSNLNTNYEKVLLYSLNLDMPFSDKLLNRKFLPIYINMIKNIKNYDKVSPFDKIIFYAYSNKFGISDYYLVYDKNKKFNPNKIKTIVTQYENTIKSDKISEVDELEPIDDNFDEDEIKSALSFKENTIWKIGAQKFLK